MKTLVAAFITALLVFTLATGWIEMVQPRLDLIAAATTSKPHDTTAKSSTKRESRRISSMEDTDEDLANETASDAATKRARTSSEGNPNRSSKAKTQLQAQLEEVKKKENKLASDEQLLLLLREDIQSEMELIAEMRRRTAHELALAERKILAAGQNRTEIASHLNDADKPPSPATRAKATPNVNAIAGAVQDLADQGSVGAAAAFLRGFNDRDAAKVLASLKVRDRRLANQLTEQLQAAKPSTTIQR